MARITSLGAGFMGSALTLPASDNGHQVRLWGTWLDDHLVEAVRQGEPHPKLQVPLCLQVPLPPDVRAYPHTELAEALRGADLVVNAVTSDGTLSVLARAVSHLEPGSPVVSASKGLLRRRTGRVDTISANIAEHLPRRLRRGFRLVVVGGPSKALELSRRVPTAVFYASRDARARRLARETFQTPYYAIRESPDVRGLEICSAFKNAYAIAIGLCDGLGKAGRWEATYNTKAALFAQAIGETTWCARLWISRAAKASTSASRPPGASPRPSRRCRSSVPGAPSSSWATGTRIGSRCPASRPCARASPSASSAA